MADLFKRLIVFTDLDGTLLDHKTYSYEAALPVLNRLKLNNIPVVLTTSKTWDEVKALQNELALDDPCIVENGSAVYLGASTFSKGLWTHEEKILGKTYAEICTFIDHLPKNMRKFIRGFADMSALQIADVTGLPIEKAEKAKNRKASEPFLWSGDDAVLAELKNALETAGLRMIEGGRFYHILSDVDKSTAIKWLLDQAHKVYSDTKFHSCALGDGPNDADMIKGVDTGIVIANPHSQTPDVVGATGRIIHSGSVGPKGWAEEMNRLLDEFGYKS